MKKVTVASHRANKAAQPIIDKFKDDPQHFFQISDWTALWEEWYLSVNSHNRPKYQRLKDFVMTITDSKDIRKFLYWYLGPDTKDANLATRYKFISTGPVDWVQKRATGGWFTEKNLKLFGHEIQRRMNALDALRQSGNNMTLNFMARSEQLARTVDEFFRGALFVPGLEFQDNVKRAQTYLEFQERLLRYHAKAQKLYARAHGINFDDMAGLVQLVQASIMSQQQNIDTSGQDKESAVIQAIGKMTLLKAARYNLPQPIELEQTVIEVSNEIDAKHTAKKKMQ